MTALILQNLHVAGTTMTNRDNVRNLYPLRFLARVLTDNILLQVTNYWRPIEPHFCYMLIAKLLCVRFNKIPLVPQYYHHLFSGLPRFFPINNQLIGQAITKLL